MPEIAPTPANATPPAATSEPVGAPLPPAPQATPARKPLSRTDLAALGLSIVGALNWGLVGLFNRNLVSGLLGKRSRLSRAVYATVGAAGAYAIYSTAKARRAAKAA